MGQVSSTNGDYEFNNNTNTNKGTGGDTNNSETQKNTQLVKMKTLLTNKKFELYKILELFNFYINMRVLDKSFILKNNIIIKELEKGNISLEDSIKEKDELYLKNMRNIKHDIAIVSKNKYTNNTLRFINILLGIMLVIFTIIFIKYKYRSSYTIINV
jgi:hypothetical protein